MFRFSVKDWFRRRGRNEGRTSHDERPAPDPSDLDGDLPRPPKDQLGPDLDELVADAPPIPEELDRQAIGRSVYESVEAALPNLSEDLKVAFLRICLGNERGADVARDCPGLDTNTPCVRATRAKIALRKAIVESLPKDYPASTEQALRDLPNDHAKEAFKMRVGKCSWKWIASALGVSVERAQQLYREAARAVCDAVFPDA